MASESSDEATASVSVPPDLAEWLDGKAAELDLDRETVVVQLVASYRAASELDDREVEAPVSDDLEASVRDVVADRVPDIADAVSARVDTGDVEAAEDRLQAEVDRVEREFGEKLDDVRQRVVQVKREADGKAPADHDHAELASLSGDVEAMGARLDEVEDALSDARGAAADLESRVDALESAADRLDAVEDRLRRVAWVVRDIEESVDATAGATAAVDRLKRSAARADVDRAVCDACEEPVTLGLLTEAACPHCEAAVTDVEPAAGFFGKPRLTVAEPDATDDADLPDASEGE